MNKDMPWDLLWPWQWVDAAAHFLYCPTMLGRDSARTRWHHRIHLIPGRLLAWVCDRYDRSLGLDVAALR